MAGCRWPRGTGLLLVWTALAASVAAAIPAPLQREIDALDAAVSRAGRLFLEKKFREAATVLRDVQTKLDKLATTDNAEVREALAAVHGRLEKAHALLEVEGFSLPPLSKLPGAASPPAAADIPRATGKETVSFLRDLAPLVHEKCAACHGRERRAGGQLSLLTAAQLFQGGESGRPVVPGKPGESLLLGKLKGTAEGERMPLREPPLADDLIAKFEKWITEGATFDGPDPQQELTRPAGPAPAAGATAEQLSAERATRAQQAWALCPSAGAGDQVPTTSFLLLGNIGAASLRECSRLAEDQVPALAALFGTAGDQPLAKGRLTLFVFSQRDDYRQFVKAVEQRDLADTTFGHWRVSGPEAYAALLVPAFGTHSLEGLLAQQIAGLYIASLGPTPRWFCEGCARAAAWRLKPDDARVAEWNRQLPPAVAGMAQPDDFLTGRLPEETADLVSYGFVRYLLTETQRFRALMEALRQGQAFDAAFQTSFGTTPSELATQRLRRRAPQPPDSAAPRS